MRSAEPVHGRNPVRIVAVVACVFVGFLDPQSVGADEPVEWRSARTVRSVPKVPEVRPASGTFPHPELTASPPLPATAEEPDRAPTTTDLMEVIENQQSQIDTLRRELDQWKSAPAEGRTPDSDNKAPERSEALAAPADSASTKDATMSATAERPETNIEAKAFGRIHTDTNWISQSPKSKQDLGNLQNATGFRRARLGAKVTVGDHVEWFSEFDFANQSFTIKDVYAGLINVPFLNEVRVGHYREPFSLEAQTSSNHITFMERSTVNNLDPGRNWGVGMHWVPEDEMGTISIGGFRTGSNGFGLDQRDMGDWAVTMRGTRLLWYEDDGRRLMEIGSSYSFRKPADDLVTVAGGSSAGLIGTDDDTSSPLLAPINIPSDQQQLFGVEWATVLGPVNFQTEWLATAVQQIGGGPVFLNGFYVQGSWFVTGEHRGYDRRRGAFGVTHVRRPLRFRRQAGDGCPGWGALELALRYGYSDFNSPNLPPAQNGDPVGARQGQGTFGINWYLNDNARLMFNYSYLETQYAGVGTSSANLFSTRVLVYW